MRAGAPRRPGQEESAQAWIAVGGVTVGTEAAVTPGGTVTYRARCSAARTTRSSVPLAVTAGDAVRGTAERDPVVPVRWRLTLDNLTTGARSSWSRGGFDEFRNAYPEMPDLAVTRFDDVTLNGANPVLRPDDRVVMAAYEDFEVMGTPSLRACPAPTAPTLSRVDAAVAQLAALVAHGNAALAGEPDAGARVEAGVTFQYVRGITFERQDGSPPATTQRDAGAAAWFRRLAGWGVTALWLDPRPLAVPTLAPHLLAAWANGSRASIVTEGVEPRLRWIATSELERVPTETDKRVWAVECVGRPDLANLAPRLTIPEATTRLEDIVTAARDLAVRMEETFWAGFLDGALARLTADDPTSAHDDVLPPSAELDRRRLFAAAVGAYVFGGMGTWNDIGPPPGDEAANAEYDRVTPALYAAILDAVAAAVNPRG